MRVGYLSPEICRGVPSAPEPDVASSAPGGRGTSSFDPDRSNPARASHRRQCVPKRPS